MGAVDVMIPGHVPSLYKVDYTPTEHCYTFIKFFKHFEAALGPKPNPVFPNPVLLKSVQKRTLQTRKPNLF